MRIKSFAKINLGLEIIGKRPDGYHDIRTLYQTISLHDDIEFHPEGDGILRLEGDDASVPWDETNLVLKAARSLRNITGSGRGASIRVAKRIPSGGGLAGGSSNAAVTLIALNRMWDLGLDRSDLEAAARDLGADVPFFLHGGLCQGLGKGDDLSELPDLDPLSCLLALPPFPIRTASVYEALPRTLTSSSKDSRIRRFLETRDFGLLTNELEAVILRTYPELGDFKKLFRGEGAVLSLVSGSGSAVFGLFADRARARQALDSLREDSRGLLVEVLPRESYRKELDAGV
jgi:4-diphosphocytidyl-2-C-methyl-D-erythritol kinase